MLVQAGSSEDGRDFAARHAEAIFTAQQTLADAQAFYADIKPRAARFGRDPDQLLVLPGHRPGHRLDRGRGAALRGGARPADPAGVRPQPAGAHPEVAPVRLRLDEQLPDDLPDEDEIEGAKSRYTLIVTWLAARSSPSAS